MVQFCCKAQIYAKNSISLTAWHSSLIKSLNERLSGEYSVCIHCQIAYFKKCFTIDVCGDPWRFTVSLLASVLTAWKVFLLKKVHFYRIIILHIYDVKKIKQSLRCIYIFNSCFTETHHTCIISGCRCSLGNYNFRLYPLQFCAHSEARAASAHTPS